MGVPVTPIPTSNDCDSTLNFFSVEPPPGENAFVYTEGTPNPTDRVRNFELKATPVTIHDVRGKEADLTLDKAGFQYLKHATAVQDWGDDEEIKAVYYKEVEEMVKEVTGASRVVVFDHMVRRNYNIDKADPTAYNRPSRRVHVDQTKESALKRVRDNLPAEEAEELLKGRFQLINVWRAINHYSARFPFALVDFSTMKPEKDLAEVTLKRPSGDSTFFLVRHNPDSKWYFMDKQAPDEPVLFKNYDSDPTKATLTAHSAFDQPCPPGVPHRESIEARALVFS